MTPAIPAQLRNLRAWTITLVITGLVLLFAGLFCLTIRQLVGISVALFTLGGSVVGFALIVGVGAAVLGGVHEMLRRPEEESGATPPA